MPIYLLLVEVLLLFQTHDRQSHADLWSLVKCLDQKGIVFQNAVSRARLHNCVGLHNALVCIWEAILTVMVSRTSLLEAAEKDLHLLQTGKARLTVVTAGHERKYGACRADIGGCVSN